MADSTPDTVAATAVVREFIRYTVETLDKEKAKQFLSKSCRDAEQFNPSEMKGATFNIGEATVEGEGDAKRVIIPTTVTPPEGAPQPPMTIPLVLLFEDGGWKIDLMASMDRLFGGSMENVISELGNAMGKAMEGIGKAIGDAMSQAFSGLGAPGEPKLPAGEIEEFERERINPDKEQIRNELGFDLVFDIDYAGILRHESEDDNRRALHNLGSAWRSLEYVIRTINSKLPLENRVAIVRIEQTIVSNDRAIFADHGKIIYRGDFQYDGYYGVDELERILPGVICGMPERIDPRRLEPEKGPVAWLNDDFATLEEKYRVQVVPDLTQRLSELAGREVNVEVDTPVAENNPDFMRSMYLWGLNRVVGAVGMVAAVPEKNEMFQGNLESVKITRVDDKDQKSVTFGNGALTMNIAPYVGEHGAFYEWEIAEAIDRGLMLKERPVIEELKASAEEWQNRLAEMFGHPVTFEIDWAGFCSHIDTNKNMFALQLLREHGIDHVYYAVSGLAEKNPNFKQQFGHRVHSLRLLHVDMPSKKSISPDNGTLVIALALHDGYKGYFTIQEMEKKFADMVSKMPDVDHQKFDPEEEDDIDELNALSDADDKADEAESDEESEEEFDESKSEYVEELQARSEQFNTMKTHIAQTMPVYAQQMLSMVGKAIAIDIDWDTIKNEENLGDVMNVGLSPVIGGIATLAYQDAEMKAKLIAAVDRVLIRNTADATQQGFSLEGKQLNYTIVLIPGMPALDTSIAAMLLKTLLSSPPKPAATKPAAKKPAAKKPAPKKAAPKKTPPKNAAPKSKPKPKKKR